MPEHGSGRIAVIADTSLQRHMLQQVLLTHGYQVMFNSDPQRLDRDQLFEKEPDLWLVDLVQTEDAELLELLLEQAQAPVLFGEGVAPDRASENYPRWERRLVGKLKRLVRDPHHSVGLSLDRLLTDAQQQGRIDLPDSLAGRERNGEPARLVWLLAASLGGPPAVKEFLDALPHNLPLGFIYAQHIDPSFEQRLPQAVGRHSQWPVNLAREGDRVRCGEVVVVPIAHEMTFDEHGCMRITDRPWPEPYSPSIDQVMLNLAQHFPMHCGVIAFSGMGSDGSQAAAYLLRQGGLIWTQDAASCACSSMPDSLCRAGFSSFSAPPQQLAAALVARMAAQIELR
jgi:chemosensory pili system protein ChpB (putative protein-glutamate methylesterase)